MEKTVVPKLYCRKKSDINEATAIYVKAILDSLALPESEAVLRNQPIVTLDALAALYAKICNPRKKVLVWFQGVIPEEAVLHGKGRLTYFAWSIIEYLCLLVCDFKLFVSESMLEHYQRKYRLNVKNFAVAACFNKKMGDLGRWNIEKYSAPSFVYAGSMAAWQCVEKTLDIFKFIQMDIPSATLKILTNDIDRAQQIVCSSANVTIETRSLDEVDDEIARHKYGFVIRDDIAVNRVATPTKINTYMAVGTIPIVSNSIRFLHGTNVSGMLLVNGDSKKIAENILCHMRKKIDVAILQQEYISFFNAFYNIAEMNKKIKRLVYRV